MPQLREHIGVGWAGWALTLPLLLASLPSTSLLFTLFAAEERPLRPAGPPLSAQPSHPCSTRLQGGHVLGGPRAPTVQESFGGLGPITAPMLGPGSLWATFTLSSLAWRT